MKQLIRRFSRVADSSTQYLLLRPDSQSPRSCRSESNRRKSGRSASGSSSIVPEGHLPVYVGEEMERFVVSAKFLNHPIFMELLERSAQEYGYEQKGVLKIPCRVLIFERVLEVLKEEEGEETADLEELRRLFSEEFI